MYKSKKQILALGGLDGGYKYIDCAFGGEVFSYMLIIIYIYIMF